MQERWGDRCVQTHMERCRTAERWGDRCVQTHMQERMQHREHVQHALTSGWCSCKHDCAEQRGQGRKQG